MVPSRIVSLFVVYVAFHPQQGIASSIGGLDCKVRIDTGETYRVTDEFPNRICLKCPPGMHVIHGKHCTAPDSIDHCQCCPTEQFQPDYVDKVTECADCKPCRQDETKVQSCNGTHDRKCECRDGYYCLHNKATCIPHRSCPKGSGVKYKGTAHYNTECELCKAGENFSNVSSKTEECLPCSRCADDEEKEQECSPESDTVCSQKKVSQNNKWKGGLAGGLVALFIIGLVAVFCFRQRLYLLYQRLTGERGREQTIHFCPKRDPGPKEKYRRIFGHISQNVIRDWRRLIRGLDWEEHEVDTFINTAEEDHNKVSERIMHCLNKYLELYPKKPPEEFVESIPNDFKQLKEDLRELLNSLTSPSDGNVYIRS